MKDCEFFPSITDLSPFVYLKIEKNPQDNTEIYVTLLQNTVRNCFLPVNSLQKRKDSIAEWRNHATAPPKQCPCEGMCLYHYNKVSKKCNYELRFL